METEITDIMIRKVLDSRGKSTVEATVYSKKIKASAKSPSGTSAGKYEVSHLPEGTMSISLADSELIPELIGMDASDQKELDGKMKEVDGTGDLSTYGGGTILAISMAAAKVSAMAQGKELYESLSDHYTFPYPLSVCIGGGAHGKVGGTDIQEYLVVSTGAKDIKEAISVNRKVHQETLRQILRIDPTFDKSYDFEGAWNPKFTNEGALEVLDQAVHKVMDETGVEIRMGLDMAASEYYNGRFYVYNKDRRELLPKEEYEFALSLARKYKLTYVEDPFHEDDFRSHARLTQEIGGECLVVGDDLFTTSPERLKRGIGEKACNGIIIKPNQIGTLTDTYEAVKLAQKSGYTPIISHRSGETDDTTISHLAVAWNIPVIKIGIVREERTCKLKELVRIYDHIKNKK